MPSLLISHYQLIVDSCVSAEANMFGIHTCFVLKEILIKFYFNLKFICTLASVGDSLAGCRPITVSLSTTILHEVTSRAISITLNKAHNTIKSHSTQVDTRSTLKGS